MDSNCKICGGAVKTPYYTDLPDGFLLCEGCFQEFVWICNSCGCRIALPEIEGGEAPSRTPAHLELWCQDCCEQRVASCDECGSCDLIEDMTAANDKLLCESCANGNGVDESPILDSDNWMNAALQAIFGLPSDLEASVGHGVNSRNSLIFTVAGEPCGPGSEETTISNVEIEYIPKSISNGSVGDRITVYGQSDYQEYEFAIGRDTVVEFQRQVQLAVLEEMYSGGGMSLICKDRKGRFVRDNGTKVLTWQ